MILSTDSNYNMNIAFFDIYLFFNIFLGPACVPYFFATVLIANLVILNLFLALLLSSFADMGGSEEEDSEPDKMQIAIGRIKRFIGAIKSAPKNLFRACCKRKKVGDVKSISLNGGTSNGIKNGIPNGFTEKNGNFNSKIFVYIFSASCLF